MIQKPKIDGRKTKTSSRRIPYTAHEAFAMSMTIDMTRGMDALFMLRTTMPNDARGETQRASVRAHETIPTKLQAKD